MDRYEKRLLEGLHEDGAEFVRSRGHHKWRLSGSQVFVLSKTPSDWRTSQKSLSTLNRLLAPPCSLRSYLGSGAHLVKRWSALASR